VEGNIGKGFTEEERRQERANIRPLWNTVSLEPRLISLWEMGAVIY